MIKRVDRSTTPATEKFHWVTATISNLYSRPHDSIPLSSFIVPKVLSGRKKLQPFRLVAFGMFQSIILAGWGPASGLGLGCKLYRSLVKAGWDASLSPRHVSEGTVMGVRA